MTIKRVSYRPPIHFTDCEGVYCEKCHRTVKVAPCPACIARKARASGAKSATSGVDRSQPRAVRLNSKAPEGIPWSAAPTGIADWVSDKLEHMIGREANAADVSEAIENLVAEMRAQITAIANTIGEDRRANLVAGKVKAWLAEKRSRAV